MRGAVNRGSDGQNQLEYIGLVVLVAVVVGVLVASPVLSSLPVGLRAAVCKVLGGDDCPEHARQPQARPNTYYRPERCLVSVSGQKYGGKVEVAFVSVGKDLAFSVKKMSDGRISLTVVDPTSVGVTTGIGVGVNAGKYAQVGAEANIGASGSVAFGDTWVFDDTDQASNFIDAIKSQGKKDAISSALGPVGGFGYDLIAGEPGETPESTISVTEISGEVVGDAGAGVSVGKKDKPGATQNNQNKGWEAYTQLTGEVSAKTTGKIVLEHNKKKNTKSTIYELGGQVGASAALPGKKWPASAQRGGSMKITRTEKDKLLGIEFTQKSLVNGELTAVTTNLPIKTQRQRQVAERWLDDNNDGATTLELTWDDMVPRSEPGAAANDFSRLVYREANVTRATYTKSVDQHVFGASARFGLVLGAEAHWQSSNMSLESAKYLGAPRIGSRRYMRYKECHT